MPWQKFEHEIETMFASFNTERKQGLDEESFEMFCVAIVNLAGRVKQSGQSRSAVEIYDNLSIDEAKQEGLRQLLDRVCKVMQQTKSIPFMDLETVQNLLWAHVFEKK